MLCAMCHVLCRGAMAQCCHGAVCSGAVFSARVHGQCHLSFCAQCPVWYRAQCRVSCAVLYAVCNTMQCAVPCHAWRRVQLCKEQNDRCAASIDNQEKAAAADLKQALRPWHTARGKPNAEGNSSGLCIIQKIRPLERVLRRFLVQMPLASPTQQSPGTLGSAGR